MDIRLTSGTRHDLDLVLMPAGSSDMVAVPVGCVVTLAPLRGELLVQRITKEKPNRQFAARPLSPAVLVNAGTYKVYAQRNTFALKGCRKNGP